MDTLMLLKDFFDAADILVAEMLKEEHSPYGACEPLIDIEDAIDKVIYNEKATIVVWKDGIKTVVKCGPHDHYDKEKGLAMAIVKRLMGNKGNYNDLFKKFVEDY